MNETSCAFEIILDTIKLSDNKLSAKELCSIAGVSRSGYYAWIQAAPTRALLEQKDREDFEIILQAYKMHGYTKGARGIQMALLHMRPSVIMNLKKIRRLMKKFNLSCPIRKPNPYRQMMKELKTNDIAENLLQREFEDYGPRTVLLTDITYLPYNNKFAYLSTILDAFTKEILAYVLSSSMKEDFVLETVEQLTTRHGLSLNAKVLFHSDRGSHYTAYSLIELLKDKNLRRSMSRKGNCWDNAPQESFYGHMKDHIKMKLAEAREFIEVEAIVDDYMNYYNNYRYQWKLAKLAPAEFYKFFVTGVYPLDIPNIPERPVAPKDVSELGAKSSKKEVTA